MVNFPRPTGYDGRKATDKQMGIMRFATDAEAAAATATDVALTPSQGVSSVPDASTTVKGKVQLATNAEAVTGTDSAKAIVPSSLTARLAAPGAIGGTTPAAGSFTTLATSGDYTATTGNVIVNTAGKGLRVKSGSNARIGVGAVLVGGTLAVANTSVTANSVIIPVITALGTVAAPKPLYVTKNAGVGFTVTSSDATDTSTFDWYIVEAI